MKEIYEAFDGKLFETRESCLDYEKEQRVYNKLPYTVDKIKEFIEPLKAYCKNIPVTLCDDDNCPLSGICGNEIYKWELD